MISLHKATDVQRNGINIGNLGHLVFVICLLQTKQPVCQVQAVAFPYSKQESCQRLIGVTAGRVV